MVPHQSRCSLQADDIQKGLLCSKLMNCHPCWTQGLRMQECFEKNEGTVRTEFDEAQLGDVLWAANS